MNAAKIFKNKYIIIPIILLAVFVRFYNINERIVYGPEQAMSLIVSGNYITDKFSLLGQRYFRETSSFHTLFSGAVFNYSLVPLQILFNFDPIKITYFFTLLNLFTGFLIYKLANKTYGRVPALISSFLFLFNSYMIYHALFIWNYNYLPLIFLISLYLIFKKDSERKSFYVGLLSGLGFSIQYLYLLTAFVFLFTLIYRLKNKLMSLILFLIGAALGNLPMLLFDVRHDFYHIRTFFNFLTDSLAGKTGGSSFEFQYYHFLYLIILFSIASGILLGKVYTKYKIPVILALIIYLFINLRSERASFEKSYGMPDGLTASEILIASEKIAEDAPANFNVAETYDFDTQAHTLRYPLEFIYNKKPMYTDDYSNSEALYVLSQADYDYNNPTPWELKSYLPYKSSLFYEINNKWKVYKLTK